MSSAETDLYQELVLEHKRSPRNFGHLSAPTHQARGTNPSCGDDLSVELNIAHGLLADIRFHGQGCAICMASASMMSEAVKGQEIATAQALQQHFRAVLAGVSRYPGRIKCALLGWHALMHAIASSPAAPAATVSTQGDTP